MFEFIVIIKREVSENLPQLRRGSVLTGVQQKGILIHAICKATKKSAEISGESLIISWKGDLQNAKSFYS